MEENKIHEKPEIAFAFKFKKGDEVYILGRNPQTPNILTAHKAVVVGQVMQDYDDFRKAIIYKTEDGQVGDSLEASVYATLDEVKEASVKAIVEVRDSFDPQIETHKKEVSRLKDLKSKVIFVVPSEEKGEVKGESTL
jgi:hypothetical protein